jgi:hypothetical protein
VAAAIEHATVRDSAETDSTGVALAVRGCRHAHAARARVHWLTSNDKQALIIIYVFIYFAPLVERPRERTWLGGRYGPSSKFEERRNVTLIKPPFQKSKADGCLWAAALSSALVRVEFCRAACVPSRSVSQPRFRVGFYVRAHKRRPCLLLG